ncbi:hypothetical protein AKO1_005229 [Acrasis kona]|uniref:BTB domain-containing protein n=1 Tax=Acrasis kona TaxID=1008807 RepID=A0AAW2YKJ2_9EUKA
MNPTVIDTAVEYSEAISSVKDKVETLKDSFSFNTKTENAEIIKIKVGDQLFSTTRQTLEKGESIFPIFLNTRLMVEKTDDGAIIFDKECDPHLFSIVLDHLRTDSLTSIGINVDDENQLQNLYELSNYVGTRKLTDYVELLLQSRTTTNNDLTEVFQNLNLKEFSAKKEEELENLRKELINDQLSQRVHFNVGGAPFSITLEDLSNIRGSNLYSMLNCSSTEAVFIDRNPDLFQYILTCLKENSTNSLPHTNQFLLRSIKMEAEYFKIPMLMDYFDPFRYPIETIGEENIKIKKNEDLLRGMFVTDRDNPMLDDPYVNLIPVCTNLHLFKKENPKYLKSIPKMFDFEKQRNHIQPEITKPFNFYRVFSRLYSKVLNGLEWDNVFLAGGSVLRSLTTDYLPNSCYNEQDREENLQAVTNLLVTQLNEMEVQELMNLNDGVEDQQEEADDNVLFRRDHPFRVLNFQKKSDIDLFLYGLTEDQAQEKIIHIYETIKKNVVNFRKTNDNKTYIIRTKHFRVQVILRLYKSPSEILTGFDVDCCCVGYDGREVWASPRAVRAIKTRMNLVDVERQSTTYEARLFKYAKRGYRVGVPGYDPNKVINDDILKGRVDYKTKHGLAKLILLENLGKAHSSRVNVQGDIALDQDKDYAEVDLTRFKIGLFGSIKDTHSYIVNHIKSDYRPPFLYDTDLNSILMGTSNDSTIQGPIQWIKLNPAFNPVDRNFYEEAYSMSENQRRKVIKKVLRDLRIVPDQ